MILVCFHRLGPYHKARMIAAARAIPDLALLEWSGKDSTYDWDPISESLPFERITVVEEQDADHLSPNALFKKLESRLAGRIPKVIVINGWGFPTSLAALMFCVKYRIPRVVMSESTPWDHNRNPLAEFLKKRLVSFFSAALCGGQAHREYLQQLGMSGDRIFLGYDAVNNRHFSPEHHPDEILKAELRQGWNLPRPFFLASGRFIPKKNYLLLIEAYAAYRRGCESGKVGRWEGENERKTEGERLKSGEEGQKTPDELKPTTPAVANSRHPIPVRRSLKSEDESVPWDLVILGDGELRPQLEGKIRELGLEGCVHLPGFKQYEELPQFYSLASAFLHPSTTEQWGLVVNEAMAAGLPVALSSRCGCAADLLDDGVNGFVLDPTNPSTWTKAMITFTHLPFEQLSRMGEASQNKIARWGPDRFADGLTAAINKTREIVPPRNGFFSRFVLKAIIRLKKGNPLPGR